MSIQQLAGLRQRVLSQEQTFAAHRQVAAPGDRFQIRQWVTGTGDILRANKAVTYEQIVKQQKRAAHTTSAKYHNTFYQCSGLFNGEQLKLTVQFLFFNVGKLSGYFFGTVLKGKAIVLWVPSEDYEPVPRLIKKMPLYRFKTMKNAPGRGNPENAPEKKLAPNPGTPAKPRSTLKPSANPGMTPNAQSSLDRILENIQEWKEEGNLEQLRYLQESYQDSLKQARRDAVNDLGTPHGQQAQSNAEGLEILLTAVNKALSELTGKPQARLPNSDNGLPGLLHRIEILKRDGDVAQLNAMLDAYTKRYKNLSGSPAGSSAATQADMLRQVIKALQAALAVPAPKGKLPVFKEGVNAGQVYANLPTHLKDTYGKAMDANPVFDYEPAQNIVSAIMSRHAKVTTMLADGVAGEKQRVYVQVEMDKLNQIMVQLKKLAATLEPIHVAPKRSYIEVYQDLLDNISADLATEFEAQPDSVKQRAVELREEKHGAKDAISQAIWEYKKALHKPIKPVKPELQMPADPVEPGGFDPATAVCLNPGDRISQVIMSAPDDLSTGIRAMMKRGRLTARDTKGSLFKHTQAMLVSPGLMPKATAAALTRLLKYLAGQ